MQLSAQHALGARFAGSRPQCLPVSAPHPRSCCLSRDPRRGVAPQRTSVTLASSSNGTAGLVSVDVDYTTEGLRELNQNDFYSYLEEQGDTVVVVDFFTDWCGPCKVIYPELLKLANERPDIRIVKFNCNRANKDLGVKLGIKVAPTFHIYKRSVKVGDMTGAQIEKLLELIDKACAPATA